MKILKSSVILLVLALCMSNMTQAQKFAHINSQELLAAMPEQAKAKTELETMRDNLDAQLKTMQTEFQKKVEDYQTMMKAGNVSDLIRTQKETALSDLQKNIQQFQQAASQNLDKKQQDLIKPIIDKAQKAIEAVGKENGFLYVFDLSTGTVVYHGPDSVDALPLVKKKLGIQ